MDDMQFRKTVEILNIILPSTEYRIESEEGSLRWPLEGGQPLIIGRWTSEKRFIHLELEYPTLPEGSFFHIVLVNGREHMISVFKGRGRTTFHSGSKLELGKIKIIRPKNS